jgi:hypothetical protein
LAPVFPFLSPSLAPEAAFSPEVVLRARLEASAQQVQAPLPEEWAARDVVAERQGAPGAAAEQQAVPDALVAPRPEEVAARVAVQRVAARGAAVQRVAVAARGVAVQRPGAAVLAGEGLLREAPSAVAWALPWAVVWAFRRDPTPPWPVPQPAA